MYGSVDSNRKYFRNENKFIVTKMNSGNPSDLELDKQGNILTQGGLILVKFIPKEKN